MPLCKQSSSRWEDVLDARAHPPTSYILHHIVRYKQCKINCNPLYPPLNMDNKTKTRIIKTTSVVSVCLRSQRSWTKCSNKMCLVWLADVSLLFLNVAFWKRNVTIKFRLACKQWQYNVFSKWRDFAWFGVIAVALMHFESSGLWLLKNVYVIIFWISQETFLCVNDRYTSYVTQSERLNFFRYCVIMCVTAVCVCVLSVCMFCVCVLSVCVLCVCVCVCVSAPLKIRAVCSLETGIL